MGLMSGLSRGLSAAGYAGAELFSRQALEEQRSALEEQKALRIAEAQHGYNMAMQKSGQEFTSGENQKGRDFTGEENQKGRDQQTALQENLFSHQTEEGALNRSSSEKISSSNNATSLQSARIHAGATLQAEQMRQNQAQFKPMGDGTIAVIRNGKTESLLTDPTTGKPMIGLKDVNEKQILIAKSYLEEAKQETDPAAKAKYSQLARDVLDGKTPPPPMPSPKSVDILKKNPTPENIKLFNDTYKQPGLAEQLIQQEKSQQPDAPKKGMMSTSAPAPKTDPFAEDNQRFAKGGKAAPEKGLAQVFMDWKQAKEAENEEGARRYAERRARGQ